MPIKTSLFIHAEKQKDGKVALEFSGLPDDAIKDGYMCLTMTNQMMKQLGRNIVNACNRKTPKD